MGLKKITSYLESCRWCNFKEDIKQRRVFDVSLEMLFYDKGKKLFVVGEAELKDGSMRYFAMPMAHQQDKPQSPDVKYLMIDGEIYTDALLEKDFWQSFMALVHEKNGIIKFPNGWKLIYRGIEDGANTIGEADKETSVPLGVEQSNTTLNIGEGKLAFKLERMLDFSYEPNLELEMNEKLMRENSSVMPKTFGYFIWQMPDGRTANSGFVQEFVKNKGDMWNYLLCGLEDHLRLSYLKQTAIRQEDYPEFLELFRALSKRTEEMEACFKKEDDNPRFCPEKVDDKFIHHYEKQFQVLCYQAYRNIKNNLDRLPLDTYPQAKKLLASFDEMTSNFIQKRLEAIRLSADKGMIHRVHGDFHLGQVMVTPENDLKFIDFAGEPGLSVNERQQKRLSVRDVAGMYRSIKGYLGAVAAENFAEEGGNPESVKERRIWAKRAVKPLIDEATRIFLKDKNLKNNHWLALEVLRKNLYEIDYELNNRPEMAYIPISGLTELLGADNGSIANDNLKKDKAAGYDLS